MARPLRTATVAAGETYHVIARGNAKMTVFHDADDYAAYLDLLGIYARICKVDIFHYCLMPNHFHLLLRPTEANLPAFMHAVQLRYARRYNKKYKRVGHVWQGRYKSESVQTDAYLFACGNYIEMNPVRAHLVARPEDWKYSSYRHYAYGERDDLVTTDPFYPSIATTVEDRQRIYRETVARTRASANS